MEGQREIRLKSLYVTNFKGQPSLKIDDFSKAKRIYGANGVGKTTILDSVLWLLFDKDSDGKSKFKIKKIVDEDGKEETGVDAVVEASFVVGKQEVTFKKALVEKWTKKKGYAKKVFSGNTTEHWINGVPTPRKTDYVAAVREICPENIFKLLTSSSHFCEKMSWEKRQELLLEIFGDITDLEVIESNKDLADLADIITDTKVEDHKKIIKARKTEINKQLEKIPVRIDQEKVGMPIIVGLDKENVEQLTDDLAKSIKSKNEKIVEFESGGGILTKKDQIQKIQTEIQKNINAHQNKVNGLIQEKSDKLGEFKMEKVDLVVSEKNESRLIDLTSSIIEKIDSDLVVLVKKFNKAKENTFDINSVCATCGRGYDLKNKGDVDAVKTLLKEFNLNLSDTLDRINGEGKYLKSERLSQEKKLKEFKKAKKDVQAKIDKINTEIESLESGIKSLKEKINDEIKENTKLQGQIDKLNKEIEKLKSGSKEEVEKLKADVCNLEIRQNENNKSVSSLEFHAESTKRIDELKAEERKLATGYEKLEKDLFVAEKFVKTKIEMLQDKINAGFKITRWKMFEEQMNGGIDDKMCEPMLNGVPYSQGLSNSERIKVGIDIITTIRKHFNVIPFLFVDNAESVTDLPNIDGQLIELIVSKKDKVLRFE